MVRPTEFNRKEVLMRAVEVFLSKGYHDASISDLSSATGLLRGSLYSAFKSKRGIFLSSIEFYFEELERKLFDVFHQDLAPIQKIRGFFEQILKESIQSRDNDGCLLVNSILEIPSSDQEIQQRIGQMFSVLEKHFEQSLKQAVEEQLLPPDFDCSKQAKHLLLNLYGFRVFSKNCSDEKQLRSTIDVIVNSIK